MYVFGTWSTYLYIYRRRRCMCLVLEAHIWHLLSIYNKIFSLIFTVKKNHCICLTHPTFIFFWLRHCLYHQYVNPRRRRLLFWLRVTPCNLTPLKKSRADHRWSCVLKKYNYHVLGGHAAKRATHVVWAKKANTGVEVYNSSRIPLKKLVDANMTSTYTRWIRKGRGRMVHGILDIFAPPLRHPNS